MRRTAGPDDNPSDMNAFRRSAPRRAHPVRRRLVELVATSTIALGVMFGIVGTTLAHTKANFDCAERSLRSAGQTCARSGPAVSSAASTIVWTYEKDVPVRVSGR